MGGVAIADSCQLFGHGGLVAIREYLDAFALCLERHGSFSAVPLDCWLPYRLFVLSFLVGWYNIV
jgi:hypothetical protein